MCESSPSPIHRSDGLPCLRARRFFFRCGRRRRREALLAQENCEPRRRRYDGGPALRLTCDDYGHPRYVYKRARVGIMAAMAFAVLCFAFEPLADTQAWIGRPTLRKSCRAGNKAATHEHDFLSLYAAAAAADSPLLLHDSKAPPPSQGLHAHATHTQSSSMFSSFSLPLVAIRPPCSSYLAPRSIAIVVLGRSAGSRAWQFLIPAWINRQGRKLNQASQLVISS